MTSVKPRQNTFRQRRLGILRNSQQLTSPQSSSHNHNLPPTFQGFDINMSLFRESTFSCDEQNHEKMRRLHQVRIDNAIQRMRTQSANDVTRSSNRDFHSLRCSTAPSCRTVREFLKDQIDVISSSRNDSVFEDKPNKVVLLGTPRQRRRLATFPEVNRTYISSLNCSESGEPFDKNRLGYSPVAVPDFANKIISSTTNNLLSSKYRRTASAPAEVYRLARSKPSENTERSPPKSVKFRFGNTLLVRNVHEQKHQNKPILRNSYSARRNSGIRPGTPKTDSIQMDDGPLGIIGEKFRQKKPPLLVKTLYRLPIKRSGLPIPIKIPHSLSQSDSSSSLKQTHPSPPATNPTYSGCSCRSVRFNCTSNLVHEYLENEPVSSDCATKT